MKKKRYHFLKLHPPEGHIQKTKKPVVSETFDVIVFTDPTEAFYKKLQDNEPTSTPYIPQQFSDCMYWFYLIVVFVFNVAIL